jgi:hypothetical protein
MHFACGVSHCEPRCELNILTVNLCTASMTRGHQNLCREKLPVMYYAMILYQGIFEVLHPNWRREGGLIAPLC